MMEIKAFKRNEKVFAHLENSLKKFKTGVRHALYEVGADNTIHLKKLIRDKNKHGRIYPFRGGWHQASAPGEAPANMTGRLATTANYKVRGTEQIEFGDKAPYGLYLEEGTTGENNTPRILPRPHVIRTVREKQGQNYKSFDDNVKKRITKL